MLRVSANRRFLVNDDGSPFFYLADTAWELFHRLDYPQSLAYLEDRASKGFTVIQAVLLAELDGLRKPNRYGECPLHNADPAHPNPAYFTHVDAVIDRANALGLYMALLPTWGDKWNQRWGVGPEVFTPENAYAYGLWLGQRYTSAKVIWVLGGDRPIEQESHRAITLAMAAGLRAGDQGSHLIGFHSSGRQSSSQYFHTEEWLDLNMWQSGHTRNQGNWRDIEADYALTPAKPCMDAEPGYEDHPASFALEQGYLDDYDCRKALYWALFAGAHGHTYGCHPIWQFWEPQHSPISFVRRDWQAALQLPGAAQMQYARRLLRSRPFFQRIPDQSLIIHPLDEGARHIRATRAEDGSYALFYLPFYDSLTLQTAALSGDLLNAYWYNPRNGTSLSIGQIPRVAELQFIPPAGGPDWVLVLDDSVRNYAPPGTAIYDERE